VQARCLSAEVIALGEVGGGAGRVPVQPSRLGEVPGPLPKVKLASRQGPDLGWLGWAGLG